MFGLLICSPVTEDSSTGILDEEANNKQSPTAASPAEPATRSSAPAENVPAGDSSVASPAKNSGTTVTTRVSSPRVRRSGRIRRPPQKLDL
jgi:hypothetical protein